jgi:HEAT repeat protein
MGYLAVIIIIGYILYAFLKGQFSNGDNVRIIDTNYAIAVLENRVKYDYYLEVARVAEYLAKIRDPRGVVPLCNYFRTSHNFESEVIDALGKIGDDRAYDTLAEIFEQKDRPWVRGSILIAMGRIGSRRCQNFLLAQAKVECSEPLLIGLMHIDGDAAVDAILYVIQQYKSRSIGGIQSDYSLVEPACLILGAIGAKGNQRCLPILRDFFEHDPSPDVRSAAALGIMWLDPPSRNDPRIIKARRYDAFFTRHYEDEDGNLGRSEEDRFLDRIKE